MRSKDRSRKDLQFCIDTSLSLKKLIWISFLPGGGISVGFFEKSLYVRSLEAGDETGSPNENAIVDLEKIYGLESVKNPHFTLHSANSSGAPPAFLHLKSENDTVLCEALVWSQPMPGQESSPWLRLVSSPINALSRYKGAAHGRKVHVVRLLSPKENCSIKIHIDFVDLALVTPPSATNPARYFTWGSTTLRVIAFCVPPQPATLGYSILA